MAHKNITVSIEEFRDDEPRYGRWITILGHSGTSGVWIYTRGCLADICYTS